MTCKEKLGTVHSLLISATALLRLMGSEESNWGKGHHPLSRRLQVMANRIAKGGTQPTDEEVGALLSEADEALRY